MMSSFLAIVLVCALGLEAESCNEASAIDVLSVSVDNEMRCTVGWQEIIARSAFRDDVGQKTYLKTLCRRVRPTGHEEMPTRGSPADR
jgi:hypothetical protein